MAINLFTVPIRYEADAFSLVQVGKLVTRIQLVVTVIEGEPVIGVLVTPDQEPKRRGKK